MSQLKISAFTNSFPALTRMFPSLLELELDRCCGGFLDLSILKLLPNLMFLTVFQTFYMEGSLEGVQFVGKLKILKIIGNLAIGDISLL